MDASYADEKAVTRHLDEIEALESSIDPKEESKLVLKMDLMIMPLVTLLFLLNFIDRSAVGNANIAGLSKDLHLSATKYEYNIGLALFYIVYIIVEPPSNLMLKKYGASWLSFLVIGFGIVTIGSAFMHTYAHFMVIRALLGAFEGGVIPAIAFLLSRFYRRNELVFRIGMFLALGPSLSGAFGGLLAGALLKVKPIGIVHGWRIIFLVYGIVTTFIGFISIFLVSTSPTQVWWLSEKEKALAVRRLESEQIGVISGDKSTSQSISKAFRNLHTWLCALGYIFINVIVQGTAIFLPTIVKTLGTFSTVEANLRTAPPYFLACIWALFVSYMAQRTRKHGIWIMISVSFSIIGYIIFLSTTKKGVLYFACFLTYSGAVPNGPIFLAWATANSSPETQRAMAAAIVPAIGTIGSIVSTWAYLPVTAPRYTAGNALNVGCTTSAFLIAALLIWYTKWENRQREEGRRDHRLEGLSQDQIDLLGHSHPQFRYLQ
ncbi:MFS general substrate transporter [Meredithblackwellia eburnea MCA 4105]